MKVDTTNRIENLLLRYCEGQVTEKERQEVEEWINESAENRRMMDQVLMLYISTDTLNILKKVDTEKALSKVKTRMSPVKKVTWAKRFQRIVAILFLPFIIALSVQYGRTDKQVVSQILEAKTAPGMTASLTLPDGTLAFLNSQSSLSYPSFFDGDVREVMLKGEGYFEVAKDKRKKFVVVIPHHSQIEVQGTSFNVEAYEQDADVTATLIEGKIGFIYQDKGVSKQVSMLPGQKLMYNSESKEMMLSETSGLSEIAWKDGKIIFNNTPLPEALRILDKRYNVKFILNNERLKKSSFTGTFATQRLEMILEHFKISSRMRWRYLHEEGNNLDNRKEKIEIY